MTREPVAVINSLVTLVEAGISFGVGFGLKLSAEQVAAIMAVVVALGNLVKTVWARGQVTPVSDPRGSAGQPLVPA
jgi:hypothetical protein